MKKLFNWIRKGRNQRFACRHYMIMHELGLMTLEESTDKYHKWIKQQWKEINY